MADKVNVSAKHSAAKIRPVANSARIESVENNIVNTNINHEQQLKSRIAKQFSRAATRYDAAAQVQIDIADDALKLFFERCDEHSQILPKRIIDIGCGTGRVTRELARLNTQHTSHIFAMDLALGMLKHAREQTVEDAPNTNISWLQGDAEHLPLGDSAASGVFSSMALQWCKNSTQVCTEINRVLAPGASGVLAIMCQGSMHELDTCWQHVDSQRKINQFASAETWSSAAKAAGLQVTAQQKSYVTWHKDVRELLGSIKNIGANVVTSNTRQKAISRNTLHALELYYQSTFGRNQGLPLTYNVCFLSLVKPVSKQ
ncbi:Methyltransferase type 11 [Paraglaciecola sp. T6c]|nr:Methyltransferase type 11 [Paraglaciecola sp. T6c]